MRQVMAQLSLLPYAGREMSTGQSVAMLWGWGVKPGWLIPYADKRVGGRLTRAVPERFRDEYHTHYKALYKCTVYLIVTRWSGEKQGFQMAFEGIQRRFAASVPDWNVVVQLMMWNKY